MKYVRPILAALVVAIAFDIVGRLTGWETDFMAGWMAAAVFYGLLARGTKP